MNPKELVDKIPVLGWLIKQITTFSDDYGWFVAILAAGLFLFGILKTTIPTSQILAIVIATTPIWVTWYVFTNFFGKWSDAVGKSFYLFNGRTTLRIKLPQEVLKSPEAMEFVISQIHNVQSPDNLMQTYLQGKRPLPFGFEIASIGGDVRFYVNLPTKKSKPAFEAAFIVNIQE